MSVKLVCETSSSCRFCRSQKTLDLHKVGYHPDEHNITSAFKCLLALEKKVYTSVALPGQRMLTQAALLYILAESCIADQVRSKAFMRLQACILR